jgi:hypothetical protein
LLVVDASGKAMAKGTPDGITVTCMPASARLVGCVPDVAIYRVGAKVSGLRISTGKTAQLLTGTKVVAISPKGLAWATGSTLHWRPLASALEPLG